ncbi:MAG: peptide chain release factor N(5)-glutamine methyltransferase [Nitrospiria bacterium]
MTRTRAAWIRWGADRLARAGVEAPRREAEALLAFVLAGPRHAWHLDPDSALTPAQAERMDDAVGRRARRVPPQYLTGSETFCGLEIGVTSEVLIPRPETEGVVTAATRVMTWWNRPTVVADVGTGSGCIALALAAACPTAVVYATDCSTAALHVAAANAGRLGLADRVRFLAGDLLEPLAALDVRFDLIVSNPPYVADHEFADLQPEVRHEPSLALRGGVDGLDFYRRIFAEAARVLAPGGAVVVEVGFGQAAAVCDLAARAGYPVDRVDEDFSGIPRVITTRARG